MCINKWLLSSFKVPPDDACQGSTQMVLQPLGDYDLEEDYLDGSVSTDSAVSHIITKILSRPAIFPIEQ
jgi:hypothetical protein